ncbi:hypothetical protein EG329_012938 [Mollisiaceae sp. DMI_Dod_QoI]|nr:hypothetical protein EG329_012938 [Helotiales sp. DMI_Dod_QoI]
MRSRIVSTRASPPNNAHRLRYTKSGCSPAIRYTLPSGVPAPLSESPQVQNPSVYTTHRISSNLVSLVTKFEALDALSLPFKVPSLQPAPLEVSSPVRRRGGGTATGAFRRLSTIFNQRGSGGDREDPFFSEGDAISSRENIFNLSSAKVLVSLSKADSMRSKKVQNKSSGNSIKKWGRVAKVGQDSPASNITAPYVKNEFPTKNKGTIRDKIRLYDGGWYSWLAQHGNTKTDISKSIAVSDGSTAKGKSSTAGSFTPNTPTPVSRKRPNENRYHPSPSTGNSRYTSNQQSSKEQGSPTMPCQPSSKRSLLLEPGSANRFVSSNSPSKSSVSSVHVSPRAFNRARRESDTRIAKLLSSRDENVGQGLDRSSAEKRTIMPQEAEREQSMLRKDMHATLDRKQISDKIQLLYRAKSLERNQASNQIKNSRTSIPATGISSYNTGNELADSDFARYLRKKSSKVAAMTKLFNNGSAPKPSVIVRTAQTKPVFSTQSPFIEHGKLAATEAMPPPTPPLMPQLMAKRKSTISPKTVYKFTNVHADANSLGKLRINAIQQPAMLQNKPSQPKGRTINEKVRLFESARDDKETMPIRKRSVFTRKLNRSLKSLFEPPSSRRSEDEKQARQGRGLNGKEVAAIVDEIQDIGKPAKIGKGKSTPVGRWNRVPPALVSNGGDGAVSEKGVGSPSAAEVEQMVVKEAECGLKEPKPVRVAEVKRMMLICKERFGDMMDKEKVQTRRS